MIDDIKEECFNLSTACNPPVENSPASISIHTIEVQDIPASPTSQKQGSSESKDESGSTPAENPPLESVPADPKFTSEPDDPTIIPLSPELKTNNDND